MASKYAAIIGHSKRSYAGKYYLLPVVKNVYDDFVFGKFDDWYPALKPQRIATSYSGVDVTLSEAPKEFNMTDENIRIANIMCLINNNVVGKEELSEMLQYAIFDGESGIAKILRQNEATVILPWIIAECEHYDSVAQRSYFISKLSFKK